MDDYDFLTKHRQIWQKKPVLQRIYREQFYAPLLENCLPGKTLEIGSGPGFVAEIAPDIWRTDILASPWVHCAVDAQHLPFAASSFDSVIGLDVLHHFAYPLLALAEMQRVLKPGGRAVLVEPWITPVSRLVYTYLHHEECDMSASPWELPETTLENADKLAFDGNPASPYLLFTKGRTQLEKALPEMRLKKLARFCSLTYLLSGGFQSFTFLPQVLYPVLYSLEKVTLPLWSAAGALRSLIVLEKEV